MYNRGQMKIQQLQPQQNVFNNSIIILITVECFGLVAVAGNGSLPVCLAKTMDWDCNGLESVSLVVKTIFNKDNVLFFLLF